MSETDRLMQEEYLVEIDKLERRIDSLEKTIDNLLKVLSNLEHYYYGKKEIDTKLKEMKSYVTRGFLSHFKNQH